MKKKKVVKKSIYAAGTFVRMAENRSGFITGLFTNEFGAFYQLDKNQDINSFVSTLDIISFAPMQTVVHKPKRTRAPRAKMPSAALIEEQSELSLTEEPTGFLDV